MLSRKKTMITASQRKNKTQSNVQYLMTKMS